MDYLILILLLVAIVILFWLGRNYATINTTDLIMTEEEFLGRIDEIMCGTSNAERAYLSDMYMNMMDDFENKLKEWVKNDADWFIISKNGEPCINETAVDSIMHKLRYEE